MARSCIVGGQGKAADVRTEVFGIAEREPCFRASLASDFEFNPIGRENENERRKTWLQQQQRKIWHFVIGFMIDTGLHCGECLEVLVDDKWVPTRMEMNLAREWYLVGTSYCGDLEYVRARIPE